MYRLLYLEIPGTHIAQVLCRIPPGCQLNILACVPQVPSQFHIPRLDHLSSRIGGTSICVFKEMD